MASVGWRVVVSGWDPLSEGGQKRRKETPRLTTDCTSVLVRESIAIACTHGCILLPTFNVDVPLTYYHSLHYLPTKNTSNTVERKLKKKNPLYISFYF